MGAGQVCVSIERIYVDQPAVPAFMDRFTERTKRLRVGAALDYSMDMGSLASERQLQTVEQHVGDAREKGATVVTGGGGCPNWGRSSMTPRS